MRPASQRRDDAAVDLQRVLDDEEAVLDELERGDQHAAQQPVRQDGLFQAKTTTGDGIRNESLLKRFIIIHKSSAERFPANRPVCTNGLFENCCALAYRIHVI